MSTFVNTNRFYITDPTKYPKRQGDERKDPICPVCGRLAMRGLTLAEGDYGGICMCMDCRQALYYALYNDGSRQHFTSGPTSKQEVRLAKLVGAIKDVYLMYVAAIHIVNAVERIKGLRAANAECKAVIAKLERMASKDAEQSAALQEVIQNLQLVMAVNGSEAAAFAKLEEALRPLAKADANKSHDKAHSLGLRALAGLGLDAPDNLVSQVWRMYGDNGGRREGPPKNPQK